MRNAATAPLICEDQLGGRVAPEINGVTETRSVYGTGTLLVHDNLDLMGIVPHLHGAPVSFALDPSNDSPRGIAEIAGVIYVADWDGERIFAYRRDGTRLSNQDFPLTHDSTSQNPEGLTGAFGTIYVLEEYTLSVHAYNSNGSRDASRDFNLDEQNGDPKGIAHSTLASDTMFVVDGQDAKVYAYERASGSRDPGRDFDLQSANQSPEGMTASPDGFIYVVDVFDERVYAYEGGGLGRGNSVPAEEFDLHPDNTRPRGITASGTSLFVLDWLQEKVYSYD